MRMSRRKHISLFLSGITREPYLCWNIDQNRTEAGMKTTDSVLPDALRIHNQKSSEESEKLLSGGVTDCNLLLKIEIDDQLLTSTDCHSMQGRCNNLRSQ